MQISIIKKERPEQAAMAKEIYAKGGVWRYQGFMYRIEGLQENADRIVLTLSGGLA